MSIGDRVIRGGLVISLTVVTAVAVIISYGHLWDLAKENGEKGAAAAVLPITVDGLILATSLVIVNAARHRSRPPFLAWLMLLAGIGATLAGNIAHGIDHGWSGSLVAGWPAVVAAGMFHLAIGEIKRGRESASAEGGTSDAIEHLPEWVATTLRDHPEPQVTAEPSDPWDRVESTPGATPPWVALEGGEDTSRATSEATASATPRPVVSATVDATPRTSRKGGTKGGTKRAPKGGTKRRTRQQIRVELERRVADLDGDQIQVQPLARELNTSRQIVRELLDEMDVRPIPSAGARQ